MSLKVQVMKARKILVGSVGVATVSFVGVGCQMTSVANLPAPPSCEVQPNDPYCYGPKPDAGADALDGGGGGGADGLDSAASSDARDATGASDAPGDASQDASRDASDGGASDGSDDAARD